MVLVAIFVVAALVSATPGPPHLVRFPTADGGIVGANVYGESDSVVILVHGARFDKESWAEQAPLIADAGFKVIAIDLRGRGESRGGPQDDAERRIDLDVLATVDYARRKGATSVSLIGASLGGWAAGQAAVEADSGLIDQVILLAATQVAEPERMRGRKLFIVAEGDRTGSGRQRLEWIRDQYERSPEPKELIVLEGHAHAQFIFESDQGRQLTQEILRFLKAK
jgi:pimeloyl-ACP methyl ester carboxylesterase